MRSSSLSTDDDFFDEQSPSSKIKSKIVFDYFRSYCRIIGKSALKIGYLDFYSGPGKYEDGTDSTPLLILKHAISDLKLSKSLITIFNDVNPENVAKLKTHIAQIPNITTLKNAPQFENKDVSTDFVDYFKSTGIIPSLVFIDPFGYKGLSLALIGSVIKDWGCDCVIFFNYNRINSSITKKSATSNIDGLFGKFLADQLRTKVKGLAPGLREKLVLDTFYDALKTVKGEHSVRFKFFMNGIAKTSHFLIFVSKNKLGYNGSAFNFVRRYSHI